MRRLMIGGAIVVPLAAGAALLAAQLWVPGVVRSRVLQAVQTRLGLPARVQGVTVGWSSIELSQVEMGDAEGVEPAYVAVDRVSIQLSIWDAMFHREAAVRALHAGVVKVEVRRDHHRFDAWWSALRASPSAAGSDTARAPRKLSAEISADEVTLLASDEHGPLIVAEAENVSFARDVLAAQARSARIGSAPGGVITLRDVELHAERVEGAFTLKEMHIGNASIALGSQDSPALRKRLRRLLPPSSGDPSAPAAAAEPEHEATAHPVGQLADSFLSHVVPGSLIALERADVTDAGQPIVRELKMRMQMTSADQMLLEGVGHTTADGVVEWKLSLWPRQLRGEGNVDLDRLPLSLISAFLPELPWHELNRSTVDAQLLLKGDGAARIGWAGRISLLNAGLYSPKIAPEAVTVERVTLEGRGHFVPAERHLEISEGKIELGNADVSVHGAVELASDHYLFDLHAALSRTPCEDVLAAIPRALLGEIAAFHLSGVAAGKLRLKADSRALSDTELDVNVEDRCDFVEVPALADLRRFTGPFVHYAVEPDESVFEMETGPGTEHWTPLEEISPLFVHAVLAHEDTQFFVHPGFSMQHIRGALVRNLEAGRYVLGASTISMQLVKNLLLRREKTLARKAQEVVLTWWIERMLDKRDILELYLNVIEYGPSVYGIRHASQYYFSREPSELSPAESVFLSTILPNPKSYHSFFENNALSASWAERMRSQIQRMQARGWYAPETAAFGLNELKAFRFYPEGSVRMPTPTPMPTKTSLLPYQPGALLSNGLPTMDQLNFATIDGGE